MRTIIHDHVSHRFIEGPIQAPQLSANYQEGTTEKVVYPTDTQKEYKAPGDENDIDILYYEAYDRFD